MHRLDFYDSGALSKILKRSAAILGVREESDGIAEIACRSRGTPRIANRLLRRVRDYAQVKGDGTITRRLTDEALLMTPGLRRVETALSAQIKETAQRLGFELVGISPMRPAPHGAATSRTRGTLCQDTTSASAACC